MPMESRIHHRSSISCSRLIILVPGDYGKVRNVLRQLEESRGDGFPLDWFRYLNENGARIAKDFLGLLPADVVARPEIVDRITAYLTSRDDRSLIWHIRSIFDEAARERAELISHRNELDAEAKRVKRREHEMTQEKLEEQQVVSSTPDSHQVLA
ncbi:hypothetical protein ACVWZ6_008060 [Bradyrhizobium sp. GM6.1]